MVDQTKHEHVSVESYDLIQRILNFTDGKFCFY